MASIEYTYRQLDKKDPYYNAYLGARRKNWELMKKLWEDSNEGNELFLRSGTEGNYLYERINPNDVVAGTKGKWGTYNGTQLDPSNLFWRNPLTPTTTGTAFRLNNNTPPVSTPNNKAYSYNEWKNGLLGNLQLLSNIYGDIDTADEFNIIGQLGGQEALNYINSKFVDANGNQKALFNNDGSFIGTNDDLKKAAALLNEYLTSDNVGKTFANRLMRGQATLPNLAKYEAYLKTNEWTDSTDINYLNEARNSIDKKYNGANFFKKYAGDKTWGTLANEFAQNDYFRNDYVVDALHVMDRLNRDAGLGDGRTLIQIYNDIINKNPDLMNDDERKYRIFRDMTRRRFKLDNNFWNRYSLLPWSRDFLYGNNDIVFKGASIPTLKEGGQIFRMLFV